MSDKDQQQIVIIKRHALHDDAHHGGAWKIAFADFMTAMMALFLVLWLISSTSDKTKQTVAQYFNPVKLVDMTTQQKGFQDPKESETRPARVSDPSERDVRLEERKAKRASAQQSAKDPTRSDGNLAKDPSAPTASAAHSKATSTSENDGHGATSGQAANGLAEPFDDPFSTLPDHLGHDAPAEPALESELEVAQGGAEEANPATPQLLKCDQQGRSQQPAGVDSERAVRANQASDAELEKLKAAIIGVGKADLQEQAGPRVEIQSTDEGLLISLTDRENYTMFAIGSSEPKKKTVEILAKIAKLMQTRPGTVVLRGHTDARPYRSAGYDNWRLSMARAYTAYSLLVQGGLDESRIEKIEGDADRRLKNTKDGNAPENRRIEILLRKEKP